MSTDFKIILGILAAIITGFFLWTIKTVILYIIIAVILNFIGGPLVELLTGKRIWRLHIGKGLASVMVLILFIILIGSFGRILLPVIMEQVEMLSKIEYSDLKGLYESSYERMHDKYPVFFDFSISKVSSIDFSEKATQIVDFSKISGLFASIIGILGDIVIAIFSVVFISYFLLKDRGMVNEAVYLVTPKKHEDKVRNILMNSKRMLSRYFIGLLIQLTAIAVLVTSGLHLLGIKNALTIGVFAGIINIIPYIGPLIGTTFGLIISITTAFYYGMPVGELWPLTLKVLAMFLMIQLLDNFVFQPLIFANSVSAHPLEIFLVILIAGTLFGILGMIVAIPIYTLIRIIAKEFLSQFRIVKSFTKNL